MISVHPSRLIQNLWHVALALSLMIAGSPATAQNRDNKPPLLSDEQIELIKVYEVHLDSEPPPRVVIPRDELRNFLKEYQEDDRIPRGKREQEDWLRADGYKQLELLFQLKARDYYKHVRVRSQIDSLRDWSNHHRRYILSYFQPTFATGKVDGLYLFPRDRETDRIEMTNFYILTQVSIDGKPMIDRHMPEESLLVQWALPRESAKFPAPEIEGWEPRFKDRDDERFVELVEWIKSLIAVNQGFDYNLEYNIPGRKKAGNN